MLSYIERYAKKILSISKAKKLCQAGGALSPKQSFFWHDLCEKNNIEFIRMYGQTECGPRISCIRGSDIQQNQNSVGKGIKNVDIKISKSNGEIFVYSEMLADGYFLYKNNEWIIQKLPIPFPTGDLGEIDQNGYLKIIGRSSRFVKIQDIRISLDEIEFVILETTSTEVAAIECGSFLAIIPSKNIPPNTVDYLANHFGLSRRNFMILTSDFYSLNGNNKKDYPLMKEKVLSVNDL